MSSLGFNLILDEGDTISSDPQVIDALTGTNQFPMMYSGGFITYNPKYTAFDPEYNIRVDFRARAFQVPSMTAYGSTQNVGVGEASRWVQRYGPDGKGEGFCVYFHENVCPKDGTVVPNGIGSTLGYSKALGILTNEVAGTAQVADGLFVQGKGQTVNPDGTVIQWDDAHAGYPANSFLGVGFDLRGDFCLTSDETGTKPGSFSGTSFTQAPCSIGIRGNRFNNTQVLTCVPLNTVPGASAVPMHTTTANDPWTTGTDAPFVDYRVDLSDRGSKVTVYNKLSGETDYNVITQFALSKAVKPTGEKYIPWSGFGQKVDGKWGKKLVPLNVGLTFTSSTYCSFFEIQKFEVTGVKIDKPCSQKAKAEQVDMTNYLQESSKNLREKLIRVQSDDNLDIDITIPAKNRLAEVEYEKNIKDKITLCAGTEPEIVEEHICLTIKNATPEEVDKIISSTETGTIDPADCDIHEETPDPEPPEPDPKEVLKYGWDEICQTWVDRGQTGDIRRYTFGHPIQSTVPDTHPEQEDISEITSTKNNLSTWWVRLWIGKHSIWVHVLRRYTPFMGGGDVTGLGDQTAMDEQARGTFEREILSNDQKIIKHFNDNVIDLQAANKDVFNWRLDYIAGHYWPEDDIISVYPFTEAKDLANLKCMVQPKTNDILEIIGLDDSAISTGFGTVLAGGGQGDIFVNPLNPDPGVYTVPEVTIDPTGIGGFGPSPFIIDELPIIDTSSITDQGVLITDSIIPIDPLGQGLVIEPIDILLPGAGLDDTILPGAGFDTSPNFGIGIGGSGPLIGGGFSNVPGNPVIDDGEGEETIE